MSDLVLNFRVAGDGQALSVLRGVKTAARDAGMAFDRASRQGAAGARATAGAWSAARRPLSETERLAQRVARDQERAARRAARAQERAAEQGARAVERAAQQKVAAEERAQRQITMMYHREAVRRQREQERGDKIYQKRQAEQFKTAVGKGGAMVVGAGRRIMGAAATGATLLTGAALRTHFANNDAARALARQSDGAATGDQLLAEAQNTAKQVRGVSTKKVLEGTSAFVTETGDLNLGREIQRTVAEVALASGADTTDVARDAAALYTNFGVRDAEGMRKALAGQIVQGKRGAFELKDAAQYLPTMAAAASRFDIGTGADAASTLGGLTQIARSATGKGAPAATAVEAMFRQLTAKAPELAKQGVKLTNEDGSRRHIFDVLTDAIAKVTDKKALKEGLSERDAKNKGLQNIFGEEGIRAISPLITEYNKALSEGRDGVQALRDKMAEASDTTGAMATLQKDLENAQGDTSARISSKWDELMSSLGSRVAPAAEALLDAVMSADWQSLVDGIGWVADAAKAIADELWDTVDKAPKDGNGNDVTAAGAKVLSSRIRNQAKSEGRALTDEEVRRVNEYDRIVERAKRERAKAEGGAPGPLDQPGGEQVPGPVGQAPPAPTPAVPETAGAHAARDTPIAPKVTGSASPDLSQFTQQLSEAVQALARLGQTRAALDAFSEALQRAGGAASAFNESTGR